VTDSNGAPLISPEVIAAFNVAPGDPKNQFVYLRGVKPIVYRVHRNMKLREGHWPDPNSGQRVVGQKLAAKYPQLQMGRTFHFGRRNWKSMRDQPDFVVDLESRFSFGSTVDAPATGSAGRTGLMYHAQESEAVNMKRYDL
jgi:hypothetical protein